MKHGLKSIFSRLNKEGFALKQVLLIGLCVVAVAGTAIALNSTKEGLIEYIGAQKDIFKSGKAASVVSLEDLSGRKGLFAVGPVDGLDGEITIFDSKPYITQVRGNDYTVDKTLKHGAFFLVWTEQTNWNDVPVPAAVKGYRDLQLFVKEQAQKAGIDASKPFPFLLVGTPVEIKWHINLDRTDGKPLTKELFQKSKEPYAVKNEPVDILGFYSEHHAGVFMTPFVPAIKEGSGLENALHMHLVSKTSKASGHIDDITLGEGMVLRLPKS